MFGASKLILLAFGAGYTCPLYFILEQNLSKKQIIGKQF